MDWKNFGVLILLVGSIACIGYGLKKLVELEHSGTPSTTHAAFACKREAVEAIGRAAGYKRGRVAEDRAWIAAYPDSPSKDEFRRDEAQLRVLLSELAEVERAGCGK